MSKPTSFIFPLIRSVLTPIILGLDKITTPTGMQRSYNMQQKIDQETQSLVLYQYPACPFCIKVRREIKRLSLNIDIKDAKNRLFKEELISEGGKAQVPCLKITDQENNITWMYESSIIIEYLKEKFADRV